MRCVMDISILTKRYSTPVAIKAIGSIVFIVAFIMMVAIPVFALIPQDQYINVFNMQGVANGTYDSTTYTIFTMLANDYGSGLAMGIMLTQCILSVICGIAFLWMNRPKLAAIPAALIFWQVIFSVFRARQTGINKAVPAKLFTGVEFWTSVDKSIASQDQPIDKATGFVQQYTHDGQDYIFQYLGNYWMLWCIAIVLLAVVIVAIVTTKTMINHRIFLKRSAQQSRLLFLSYDSNSFISQHFGTTALSVTGKTQPSAFNPQR